jgi:hypothetical protein
LDLRLTRAPGDGASGASRTAELRTSFRRLILLMLSALIGLGFSLVLQATTGVRVHELAGSATYSKAISALLATGLFASVYGISLRELRRNARVVLVAITLGVAFKAILTGGIMALVYRSAGFLLLGVAVAQIDPLSVAASLKDSTVSQRAKSVLSAWASFDDPVTVLLVAYMASLVLPATRGPGQAASIAGITASSYLSQIALNALLVAIAGLAWYLLAILPARHGQPRRWATGRVLLLYAILAGLMVFAVSFGLLVGITVCALFYRPPLDAVVSHVVGGAFYAATFMLGMLLVTGIDAPAGLLLGVSVFLVQVVAGLLISRGMPSADRAVLALGQQNGLTAIALALALQAYLPSAVGVVAVAVLTVNVIHIVTNRAWDIGSRYKRPENYKAAEGREMDEVASGGSASRHDSHSGKSPIPKSWTSRLTSSQEPT